MLFSLVNCLFLVHMNTYEHIIIHCDCIPQLLQQIIVEYIHNVYVFMSGLGRGQNGEKAIEVTATNYSNRTYWVTLVSIKFGGLNAHLRRTCVKFKLVNFK